jgi:hypothetical protein
MVRIERLLTAFNFARKTSLMAQHIRTFAALLLAAFVLLPNAAFADGAVAVAEPKDVARDGYAFGISGGYATEGEARTAALNRCRSEPSAPPATIALCTVVQVFRNACASGSLDPEAGTPGAGWAIGPTRAEAEKRAIEACQRTAGEDRRQFCEVTATQCDGTAR